MTNLTLIMGGARSGKSRFAQQLAEEVGGKSVLYIATAEAGDEEMARRIDRHRHDRPASWHTLEVPRNVGRVILERKRNTQVILIDCVTLLVSNLLIEAEDPFSPEAKAVVQTEIQDLLRCVKATQASFFVVSNEVGMGLVPPYPLGRAYRDLVGQANQTIAKAAHQVYFVIAGIPLSLKE